MTEQRDYYEILGVARDVDQDEIRRAYRRLARQCHPDVNHSPEAAEQFKQLNEAYQVLNDPRRRSAYDRWGHAGLQDMGAAEGFEGFAGFGGLGDIFEDLFGFGMGGAARTRHAPQRGSDLQSSLRLTLREAVFGAEKELTIDRLETCEHCGGTGAEPGTTPSRCPTCDGSGEVRRVQQTVFGSFMNVSTCPNCGGRGEILTSHCSQCHGERLARKTRTIKVKVPAGVDNGIRIRLAGEGNAGLNGGPSGNLYVSIQVEESKEFRRQGDDLIYEMPINVVQAALGTTVTVPTLEGEETIHIPAGVQGGHIFRLRNKGVPHLQRNGRGDFVVITRVLTPTKLTQKQRELLEEFGETLGEKNLEYDEPSFVERMKNILGL